MTTMLSSVVATSDIWQPTVQKLVFESGSAQNTKPPVINYLYRFDPPLQRLLIEKAEGDLLIYQYTQFAEEDHELAEMDLADFRRLSDEAQAVSDSLSNLTREELAMLAFQAKGNWQASEGEEPAVTIVRRLREEWD